MGALTDFINDIFNGFGWDSPGWVDGLVAAFIGSILVFTVVLTTGGLFTFAFRRIFARMGQRRGPNRVGPFGILQFVADGIKLIAKEDVRPSRADRLTWAVAVYIAVAFTVLAWSPLPWSQTVFFSNIGTGILFILAVSAIAPLAEIMAGWGSNNKYSLFGGVRAAAMDVSYEIPLLFAAASVILMTGTLSTQGIVEAQAGTWFIVPQIVGFGIFLVTGLAKAGLVPTDMAESESELVAGFTTEYSGMRFGMFFVVIFSNVFFIGALVTMLYLGGWQAPFASWAGSAGFLGGVGDFFAAIPGLFWFAIKALLMSFVIFWIWTTLPRVRIDSFLNVAWRILLPISILNFVATAVVVRLNQNGVI